MPSSRYLSGRCATPGEGTDQSKETLTKSLDKLATSILNLIITMADLFYNGQVLVWNWGKRKYKATSGLLESFDGEEDGTKDGILDYRYAKYANKKSHGPTPPGLYQLIAKDSKKLVPVANWAECKLRSAGPRTGIQKIPRGPDIKKGFEGCEDYWINWGFNRIKFFHVKGNTYGRDGFYLHDSTKAYSHGCIEVDKKFFADLRLYSKGPKNKNKLFLKVTYKDEKTHTYGFTDSASTPVEMLLP